MRYHTVIVQPFFLHSPPLFSILFINFHFYDQILTYQFLLNIKIPNDPRKQLFYPTGPSFFPLGYTPLDYPPYLAGPFDWPRSRRSLEEAFWKRVPELQSFGHAHSFQRTIVVIEYGEKLKLLTIQEGNNVVVKKFITLSIWYAISFRAPKLLLHNVFHFRLKANIGFDTVKYSCKGEQGQWKCATNKDGCRDLFCLN